MLIEVKNVEDKVRSSALITISQAEIEDRGSKGSEVVQIDVSRLDGSIQRYWITMKQHSATNKIFCEVAVNDIKKPQSRKKSIFGSWFKQHVPVTY